MASRLNFQERATKFKANWLQKKWKKLMEILLLSCVILVVWMVFTVAPAIVFALTSANDHEVCN